MIKKISKKDREDWLKFIEGKEKIFNKDKELSFKNNESLIRTIDLHGYNLEKANKEVEKLLTQYYKENISKVIIITGKGNRSNQDNNPYVSKDLSILKYSIPEFIKENVYLKKIIKDLSKAEKKDGGDGAFYVYLKKFKE